MNKRNRLDILASQICHNGKIEPAKLRLLVFFLQLENKSFDYAFDIHHFRVVSPELEGDLDCLKNAFVDNHESYIDSSQEIKEHVIAASLDELELAAATVYFQNKGYNDSDIERVLCPDKDLLFRANQWLSKFYELAKTKKGFALSGAN